MSEEFQEVDPAKPDRKRAPAIWTVFSLDEDGNHDAPEEECQGLAAAEKAAGELAAKRPGVKFQPWRAGKIFEAKEIVTTKVTAS